MQFIVSFFKCKIVNLLLHAWYWSFLVLIIRFICHYTISYLLPISMKTAILEIAKCNRSEWCENSILSFSTYWAVLCSTICSWWMYKYIALLSALFAFTRELNDNQLTGNIPPELGKLTDLFDLYVLISLSVFSYYFLYNILTSDVLAEMSPTTTLKGLFLIILAHAQISTACKYFVLFLTRESFSHFKILDQFIWF